MVGLAPIPTTTWHKRNLMKYSYDDMNLMYTTCDYHLTVSALRISPLDNSTSETSTPFDDLILFTVTPYIEGRDEIEHCETTSHSSHNFR